MAIYETYSQRQKKLLKQGEPDPYRYDFFPQPLRVQIINLLTQNLGTYYDKEGDRDDIGAGNWNGIHKTLAHEYGMIELAKGNNVEEKCLKFFLQTQKVEECLDFVELAFSWVEDLAKSYSTYRGFERDIEKCEQAITELNYRLREQGIGFQFQDGKIIRVDSQFIHAEIVKPALALLHEVSFAGASEEFLQAHEHYRAQRYPEAIAGALKGFESTIKGICDLQEWKYPDNATAKVLIEVIFSMELIPPSLASHFSGLRSVLVSGLPTVRNKQGGHGQGKDSIEIPSYLAAYALHLGASNIVMLIEAHKTLKK